MISNWATIVTAFNAGRYVHNNFIMGHPDLTQDVVSAVVKATMGKTNTPDRFRRP
jgi:hypothetical protein